MKSTLRGVGLMLALVGATELNGWAIDPKVQGDAQLREAISSDLSQLGELEPWQKVILQEEVIAHPQRFIKNFQVGSTGQSAITSSKVEVDSASIRNYLKFHAVKGSQGEVPTAGVIFKPALSCAACTQVLPAIRTLVRARVERRGFRFENLSLEGMASQMTGLNSEESLEQLAKQKGASLLVSLEWAPVAVEELDTAHADEKVYRMRVQIKPIGSGLSQVKKDKEILELESFETSFGRLWTDAMTELGAKVELEETRQSLSGNAECRIEITGIRDYQQYKKMKSALENQLKPLGLVEEKVISHKKFVFVISTQKGKEDVKRVLSQLPVESGVGSLFQWRVE